jgi:hypothetical protein
MAIAAPTPTAYEHPYYRLLIDIGHSVPEVSKILAIKDGNVVSVWTIIEGFDRGVRNRIYSAERDLAGSLSGFKFDFHVLEGTRDADIKDAEVVYTR